MAELGDITPAEHDFGVASPLGIAPTPTAERYPAAHFVDEVKKFVETDPRFGSTPEARRDLLYEGGLRIYTTIDLPLQAAAEAAVAQVMPARRTAGRARVASTRRPATCGRWSAAPTTSATTPTAQYNLAMGKGRGTGSAFKPIVLATALAQGIPLSEVLTAPPDDHARTSPAARCRGTCTTPIPAKARPAAPTSSRAPCTRSTRCSRS